MKTGALNHMKTKRLKQRLGLPVYQVAGLLETLWQVTTESADEGNIGRYSDADICMALEWEGDPTELITALVETGWLDRDEVDRLVVHDWIDHCPEYIRERIRKRDQRNRKAMSPVVPDAIGHEGTTQGQTATGSPVVVSPSVGSAGTSPEAQPVTSGGELRTPDLRNCQKLIDWAYGQSHISSRDGELRVLAAAERALSVTKLNGKPVGSRIAYFVSLVRDRNWSVITDADTDRAKSRHANLSRKTAAAVSPVIQLQAP